jgi:hypothetical protein
VDWLHERLTVGDEILIKVRETEEADAPKDLRPEDPVAVRKTDLGMSRKYYAELKREMQILEQQWGAKLHDLPEEDA